MKLFGIIIGSDGFTRTIWPDFKGIMGPGSDCKGVMYPDLKGIIISGDGCMGLMTAGGD